MSDVTIAMNLGNFASLVALAPTRAMIEEFQPTCHWRALRPANRPVTPPPSADDPLAEYKARRKRTRDAWAQAEFQRDCDRLGLDARQTPLNVDATAANLAMQYLADTGGDVLSFVTAALNRAFVERLPIATMEDVASLIDPDGFAEFAEGPGEVRLEEVENELAEAMIYAGPAYIVEGESFIGRQHFPLMGWLLGGQQGTPPV